MTIQGKVTTEHSTACLFICPSVVAPSGPRASGEHRTAVRAEAASPGAWLEHRAANHY